jgi:CHASE1-domain containing sensor protein
VTSGARRAVGRSGSETGRYTARRLRSAFSLWRASVRGADILVASVLVALSLGLGAYLLARAQAAAHLAFAERAQHMLAAVTERLLQPSEDLATLQSLLEASGHVTRRQFRLLTDPMLRRHRLV